MEVDCDSNAVSEAGKSHSIPVFPPFILQLPSELALKILDSVSGVDVAKVSCVCSELRQLVSSDDLWKQKYVAEFGNYKYSGSDQSSFKERFVKAWEGRKSGNGGSCLKNNVMRRDRFNPFGCDIHGDDNEWIYIARLCMPRIAVSGHGNGMRLSNGNQDS